MDTHPAESNVSNKAATVSNTVPIRIRKATARQLKAFVNKCNRKPYGRSVKIDDVVGKAIGLLNDANMEELQRATYTSKDQLEIEYKKYCSTKGNISKDEFVRILLKTALPAGGEVGPSLEEDKVV